MLFKICKKKSRQIQNCHVNFHIKIPFQIHEKISSNCNVIDVNFSSKCHISIHEKKSSNCQVNFYIKLHITFRFTKKSRQIVLFRIMVKLQKVNICLHCGSFFNLTNFLGQKCPNSNF